VFFFFLILFFSKTLWVFGPRKTKLGYNFWFFFFFFSSVNSTTFFSFFFEKAIRQIFDITEMKNKKTKRLVSHPLSIQDSSLKNLDDFFGFSSPYDHEMSTLHSPTR
jgi:hypothetical protein